MNAPSRFAVIKDAIHRMSSTPPALLALLYLLIYVVMENVVENPIRLYIYNVFLALSGIYFAWFTGGRLTMYYVAFFNIFIVFIFSKMMWNAKLVVTGEVFQARTFLVMYLFAACIMYLMMRKKSPADKRQDQQLLAIEQERGRRQNLEFMIATRKLKHDLLAQANLVKDELQLLEGAWKSNIHDILNDLPEIKERDLYRQILLPFQEKIIGHLRELEGRLTFDVQRISLFEVYAHLAGLLQSRIAGNAFGYGLAIDGDAWQETTAWVRVDRNKVWDMLLNILRNAQAALDFLRIERLRSRRTDPFSPCIRVEFLSTGQSAQIRVTDNGGGLDDEVVARLYREPVVSRKRKGEKPGQGSLFVKFFADRMGMTVSAENTVQPQGPGLAVTLDIPLDTPESDADDEPGGKDTVGHRRWQAFTAKL